MLDTFFGAVFVGLVVFGLLALCYAILLKALLPRRRRGYYIIVPARRCDKDVATAAYAARMKLHFIGDEAVGSVVVLDCGMDERQRLSCLNICRETNGIYLCTPAEFEEMVK